MAKKKQDSIPGPPVPSGGYSLPLIMIGQMENFVKEVGAKTVTTTVPPLPPLKKFEDEIKPKPVIVIKKKKKVTKKKVAKKKEKPKEEPERPSPFKPGDEVWVECGSEWKKFKVVKCGKPQKGSKDWTYDLKNERDEVRSSNECEMIPAQVFTLIATDAVKMKEPGWTAALNDQFDGKAKIFAVYRKGQKRPWCYYVIPDPEKVWKEYKWKGKNYYGATEDMTATLQVHSSSHQMLRLIPIASAPSEILSYLGLKVYNRQYKRDDNGEDTEAG